MVTGEVVLNGELDSDCMFTGTAEFLNTDDLETREYVNKEIEFVLGELLTEGKFVITVNKA